MVGKPLGKGTHTNAMPGSRPSKSAVGQWRIVPPATVGLDAAVLAEAGDRLASFAEANLHSLLVVRHSALAYERYFEGEDEAWGDRLNRVAFDAGTKHDLRSISKSVTALLVGVAIERGLIGGIDDSLFAYFPDHADLRTPEKDAIRLRHLLTMSPGFDWDEYLPFSDPRNSEMRMYRAPDPCRFVLEQPLATPPGKFFRYNSGATELLGAVVASTSGQRIDAFAREALFDPLGITDFDWNGFSNGTAAASAGLRLRPRDMAKLGLLAVERGRWQGRQIVPSGWIEDSLAPQIGCPDRLMFYGYQWWLGRSLVARREIRWAAAIGLGGQHIFVVPEFDLVVVMTAGLYRNAAMAWIAIDTLNRWVLQAITAEI
jgi:CubicO group peptidase (beta-lactamase class C family)